MENLPETGCVICVVSKHAKQVMLGRHVFTKVNAGQWYLYHPENEVSEKITVSMMTKSEYEEVMAAQSAMENLNKSQS